MLKIISTALLQKQNWQMGKLCQTVLRSWMFVSRHDYLTLCTTLCTDRHVASIGWSMEFCYSSDSLGTEAQGDWDSKKVNKWAKCYLISRYKYDLIGKHQKELTWNIVELHGWFTVYTCVLIILCSYKLIIVDDIIDSWIWWWFHAVLDVHSFQAVTSREPRLVT